MREASYADAEGRMWAVLLPEGVPEADAVLGLPLGPPSMEPLGLPLDAEVRLHNQLFARRLFTRRDVKARRMDIFGALQAALRVDITAVAALYAPPEPAAAPIKPEEISTPGGVRGDGKSAPKRGQRRKRRR